MYLFSALNLRLPGVVFGSDGVVGHIGVTGAGIVGSWLTPELLWLDVHFSRGFLNELDEPHVPIE